MNGSKFVQFLLILFFSGSTVLIGAKELQKRWVARHAAIKADPVEQGQRVKTLIQELRGEVDPVRPHTSRKQIDNKLATAEKKAVEEGRAPAPAPAVAEAQQTPSDPVSEVVERLVP